MVRKVDVIIGGVYIKKVSGVRTRVRVLRVSRYGGWEGVNLATGHAVRIKSHQGLTALPDAEFVRTFEEV